MSRRAAPLILEDSQRSALRELERADGTPQALALRARLILRYEELGEVKRVAEAEGNEPSDGDAVEGPIP